MTHVSKKHKAIRNVPEEMKNKIMLTYVRTYIRTYSYRIYIKSSIGTVNGNLGIE